MCQYETDLYWWNSIIYSFCRYLKSLVTTFNESTSSIIEKLRPLADGKSVVPLTKYIQLLTFDVISKVRIYYFSLIEKVFKLWNIDRLHLEQISLKNGQKIL